MEKINKLFRDSEREHKKIADAANVLLRGEITGEEFQKISDEALKKLIFYSMRTIRKNNRRRGCTPDHYRRRFFFFKG